MTGSDLATVTPGAGLTRSLYEVNLQDKAVPPHGTRRETEAWGSRAGSMGSHSPGAALGGQPGPSASRVHTPSTGPAQHHATVEGPLVLGLLSLVEGQARRTG